MLTASGTKGTIGKYLQTSVNPFDFRNYVDSGNVPTIEESTKFIHLAGIVGEKKVIEDLERSYEVNVLATINLASKLLKLGIHKFIYVSSSHVYQKSNQKLTEESPEGPSSQYAFQKLETERGLREIFESDPEKLTILRVFSVLKWGGNPETLGYQIKRAAKDSKVPIKNVDDVRDFLHPKQIAEIILKVSARAETPPILNVCSGKGISVRTAATTLALSRDYSINSHQLIPGTSDTPFIEGDNTKLLDFLKMNEINLNFQ